jgi:hypothetical protein
MSRFGYLVLIFAAALFLLANGILGLSNVGTFSGLANAIFNGSKIITIILSVCGIAAGIFLLLSFFKINIPITEWILIVFIIVWIVFIVIVDIVKGFSGSNIWTQLESIAAHLMILGALITSTKRFGGN